MFEHFHFEPTGFVDSPVVVSLAVFKQTYEYSRTLPTGTVIGKTWRRCVYSGLRDQYEEWWMGTYVDVGSSECVGIRWQPLLVAEAVLLHAFVSAFLPWP